MDRSKQLASSYRRRRRRLAIIGSLCVLGLAIALSLYTAATVFVPAQGELVSTSRSPDGMFLARASFVDWATGAWSPANDGLWRVTIRRWEGDSWGPARTIFLDYVSAMDNGGPFPLQWHGDDRLTIDGRDYDPRTAKTIGDLGFSDIMYLVAGVKVAAVFVIVFAIGLGAILALWWRAARLDQRGGRPQPGWYLDPWRLHQLRYWDGSRWTPYGADNGVQHVDPWPTRNQAQLTSHGHLATPDL